MAILDRSKRLKKELSLLGVSAISAGATLSSGFFLLPGLVAAEAGPPGISDTSDAASAASIERGIREQSEAFP